MKNHESCPTGSTPFPEANVITHNGKETKNRDHSSSSGRGRGRGRDQWRGRGRGRGYGRDRGGHLTNSHSHQKWERRDDKEKSDTNICYRCKGKGDFDFGNAIQFDVADFLTSLEVNNFDFGSTTHLEAADFFTAQKVTNRAPREWNPCASINIEKVLKRFSMDTTHPLSSPMVVRSLEVEKDPFRPRENDEEILCPEVSYLSEIGALMYLANTGYLSDPHNGRSQTGYVFTYGGTAISWRSMKQTIAVTSSNHSEILAIHEASRECVWLRSVVQHIKEVCGLSFGKEAPTTLYEDNAACIAQLKE
ncbi:uncharacterized protein LOC110717451 [Chenopodium quinoa]|uniref:uncharacterized protein LOC110717451 n=1 Tax=Chenopodium quinoa TaxID=63459 RepID=UPI000B79112B|nr:uncharacterized protein LOC110717451 [Chenopodium quinoa]